MKRLLTLGLSAALLAGCGSDATSDRVERQADRRACDGFGFQRGTDAHSNCMMQQATQRAERDERARDRETLDKSRWTR